MDSEPNGSILIEHHFHHHFEIVRQRCRKLEKVMLRISGISKANVTTVTRTHPKSAGGNLGDYECEGYMMSAEMPKCSRKR